MKKTILLLAVAFLAFTANAQKMKEAEVPALVKASFTKQYPGVTVNKWEKEKGMIEANFTQNNHEMSVLINGNGTIMETETEMKPTELMPSITKYCAEKYAGKSIKEASKIVDSKGVTTYEAEVNGMDVIFDAKGNFVKETKDND
jgi:hypothetical protein